MKPGYKKIFDVLGGRLARNIYYWAFVIVTGISGKGELWGKELTVLMHVNEMVLIYFNNLVLVPRLLAKRKYPAYFISVLAATFVISCTSIYTLKLGLVYHNQTIMNTSVLSAPPITSDLSFTSVVLQMKEMFSSLLGLTFLFTMAWYMMDYSRQQKATEEAQKKQLEAELLLLKEQKAAEEAMKKQVETELLFLKSQINPHFLFNTLNNVYGLAIQKSDSAPGTILKLSNILRYLLYESNAEKISFSKEKEIMLAYIDLELLRLSDKENFHYSITSDAAYDIPPLLWLPVLENIFKHGTRFGKEGDIIEYCFAIKNNILTIFSKNNYDRDLSNNGMEKTPGIGLSNLKQRLDIIFSGKYKMEINPDNEYYVVHVEIMLK